MVEVALTPTASSCGRSRPTLPHDVARRLVRAAALGDRRAREQVVAAYRPLICKVAHGRSATLPPSVDVDDLISCGMFALNQSIDRYDGGAVDFETYALIRVRGAITDHLRELDWAPRRLRSEARRIRGVEHDFAARNGRLPSDSEVAELAELSAEHVGQIRRELAACQIVSLNVRPATWDPADGAELLDAIVDEDADDPCAAVLRDDQAALMRITLEQLGDRDRAIFHEVVLRGVPSTRVASVHGITEGRVSQILRRIREQLTVSLVDQAA